MLASPAKRRLEAFSAYIGDLRGWRRLLLACLLGVLSALAFPPYYATPLLWVAYPVLLWQLDGVENHRKACLVGWAFGFGQFALGFYWISVSMFTDIAHWWWAVPFASTILPILLGFIPGFAVMLWWRMRLTGVRRVLMFTAWMLVGEWFRGHFLTGFPWNLTAHTWIACLPLLQSYSLIGAYGLGFLTIGVASMPSLLGSPRFSFMRSMAWNGGALAVLGALALWGAYRIPAGPTATVPGVVIRLVQPNVSQSEKWSKDQAKNHFTSLVELSRRKGDGPQPSIIVWPETAVPYLYNEKSGLAGVIGSLAPASGLMIVGVARFEGDDYFNSLVVIDPAGHELGRYDKVHLAPFGEYMPFRSVLPLDALAVGGRDLSAGVGATTLSPAGVPPFSPLICYEAIFPENLVDPSHRPQWLLQITNDGWFGKSSGPYQHFAMASARAVEQGLPLLRSANTGISGAVDAYGRVLAPLPIGVQGVLDVALPNALQQAPFYSRHGDLLFFLMLGISFLVGFPSSLVQKEFGEILLQ